MTMPMGKPTNVLYGSKLNGLAFLPKAPSVAMQSLMTSDFIKGWFSIVQDDISPGACDTYGDTQRCQKVIYFTILGLHDWPDTF